MYYLLVTILFKEGYVRILTFERFCIINQYLFSFNLLPILPLDGGMLLNKILDLILPYKYSHIFSIIVSLIFLPIILMLFKNLVGIVLFVFILLKLIKEIKLHKLKFHKFLLERYLYNYDLKKGKLIFNINCIKRNKKCKIKKDNIIYEEREFLEKVIYNYNKI